MLNVLSNLVVDNVLQRHHLCPLLHALPLLSLLPQLSGQPQSYFLFAWGFGR